MAFGIVKLVKGNIGPRIFSGGGGGGNPQWGTVMGYNFIKFSGICMKSRKLLVAGVGHTP